MDPKIGLFLMSLCLAPARQVWTADEQCDEQADSTALETDAMDF